MARPLFLVDGHVAEPAGYIGLLRVVVGLHGEQKALSVCKCAARRKAGIGSLLGRRAPSSTRCREY